MIPRSPGRAARRWVLPLLLAVFAALAGLYSLATPIFEGPDEIWHFAFASYLADGGGLPILSVDHPDLLLRNAAHPPLYFLPVAALIAPIDRSDFPASVHFNLASPSITPGSQSDRPNLVIHGRNEDFPYRQSVLAVHVGRLVSIVLGVVTIVGVWAVARQLAPAADEWLALATVAVAAFIPQFVYGSAIINNDSLAAAGGAWTLAGLLALTRTCCAVGAGVRARRLRWAALSGLALGITLLSKIGMVALAPLPLVALALANWDLLPRLWHPGPDDAEGRSRWLWAAGAVLLIYGMAGLVAGWWYLRNWILYGDPLAWRVWQVLAGVGRPTPTPAQFASDMAGLFGTFWADFGLRVDRQWWWIFAVLVFVALGGWGRRVARRDLPPLNWPGMLLAIAAFGALLASAVRYSLVITDIHGRLLYPAIVVAAFYLVVGLAGWGRRAGAVLVGGTIAGLFVTTLVVPFALIEPAYARPVLLATAWPAAGLPAAGLPAAGLPAAATPAATVFGGQVQLVGYRLVTPRVGLGQVAHLLTYWRTQAAEPHQIGDLRANMALILPDGHPLGHSEVLLGSSVYPSSEWIPADTIVADLAFTPPHDADLPSVASIWLSVRGADPEPLATDHGSNLVLGQIVFSGPGGCAPTVPTDADFGGLIRLLGYRLTARSLTLCWKAEQAVPADYTVFVHILGPAGQSLGDADGRPRLGLYPTTVWLPGEVIADEHPWNLPARATVNIGLYQLESGERLSLAGSGDTELTISP